jgi:hypothetical protein
MHRIIFLSVAICKKLQKKIKKIEGDRRLTFFDTGDQFSSHIPMLLRLIWVMAGGYVLQTGSYHFELREPVSLHYLSSAVVVSASTF